MPIRSRLSPPRPSILPSLGRYSTTWVLYRLLSTLFLSHQSLQFHHRALLLQSRLCTLRSRLQERLRNPSRAFRPRQPSHHPHMILPPLSNHLHSFLSIFPYYSRTCNPMLLMFYILRLVVLLVFLYIVLS